MDFAYKAVLTSAAVALVLLAARTFGDKVAGLLAGLPFTTLPALVWTGMEQGPVFAAQVSVGSVVGCIAVAVFALVYDGAARRFDARLALVLGLAALLASAFIAHSLGAGVGLASGLALAACIAALAVLGRDPVAGTAAPRRAGLGIALTAISAGAISAMISGLALGLSAPLAGLIAALPVVGVATVWVEHVGRGPSSVTPFLRGYLVTSLGKAAFGAVFAVCVVPSGIFGAMTIALVLGALLCAIGNRWLEAPAPTTEEPPAATGAKFTKASPPDTFDDTMAGAYVETRGSRIEPA